MPKGQKRLIQHRRKETSVCAGSSALRLATPRPRTRFTAPKTRATLGVANAPGNH